MSQKLLVVIVLILTVLGVAYMKNKQAEPRQRPQTPAAAVPVQVVTAKVGEFTVMLPSQGVAKARTESTISAQIGGNVTAVSEKYREGAYFEQGEWILSIDDRDYKAATALAEANVDRARVAITQQQADAQLAQKNWARLNPDKPATDLVLRKPQLAAARSELKSAQAGLDSANLNLERTRITAPFSGKLTSKLADLGQFLTPGRSVAGIVATDNLEIQLPISSKWRQLLNSSTDEPPVVEVRIDADDPAQVWLGKIVNQSATIDEQSRQIMLFAEVPASSASAGSDLLIGDYVSAKIKGKTLKNVVQLPRQSLVDGNAIWIVKDGLIFKQDVEVEWLDDEHVVIAAGDFPNGSQVNTTALGYMISGSRVRTVERDGTVLTNTEEKPSGGRMGANRPNGNRPSGNRPNADRPSSDRPGGNRPDGNRPEGNRPEGMNMKNREGKPAFNKPEAGASQ